VRSNRLPVDQVMCAKACDVDNVYVNAIVHDDDADNVSAAVDDADDNEDVTKVVMNADDLRVTDDYCNDELIKAQRDDLTLDLFSNVGAPFKMISNATTGVSPYKLVYGHLPRGPLAILKEFWTGQRDVQAELSKPV